MAPKKPHVEKHHHKRLFRQIPHLIPLVLFILIIVILPLFVLGGFELYYLNRVMPGVRVGNAEIGGMTRDDAEIIVARILDDRRVAPLSFVRDESILFTLESAAQFYWYDIDETIVDIMSQGRKGNYIEQLRTRLSMMRNGNRVSPVYGFDKDLMDSTIAQKLKEFEDPVQDAYFVIEGKDVVIEESKPGFVADRDAILSELDHYWAFTRQDPTFILNFKRRDPTISDQDLEPLLPTVRQLASRKLSLTTSEIYGQTFAVEGTELFSFLRAVNVDGSVSLQFDEYKVAEKLKNVAELVKKDPIDATFNIEGDRAVDFQPAQDGLALDSQNLTAELLRVATDETSDGKVEIPLKRTPPAITTASVNDYGIREVIGTGRSIFTGSAAGRVHNVALGSSKLNGVIIAPGEVFSMYKAVGEIEAETGFKDAYIIKNGRTIPGVGGGVCQVSTTLFRAVLNAGLPIVERKAHAYRVTYYEKDSPPGLDAAVYFPSWDFKFKNDTENHILIQAKVDTKRMTAEYNLFGVKDGRIVEMTKPVVSGTTPPPPDLYQDDPTLAKGITKQVDYAAWGATVSFSRKVMKNGQMHLEDTFKSGYKPWQAVFMVGTKEN